MSIRPFSLSVTLLAAALAVTTIQPLKADEPKPQAAASDAQAPQPTQADDPPEGGPRRGGREGGGREGARRGEGGPREGGPREGGGAPQGGMNMTETPEQSQERMKRVLRPYLEMVPDLNEDQQIHIFAIVDASGMEVRALRANSTFSAEEKTLRVAKVRALLPERIKIALTDAQVVTYSDAYAAVLQTQADMAKIGSVRPDEGIEELRARVLQGYEPVFEELSVKQKTQVIKTLEASAEEAAAVDADTKLTPDQKLQAKRKIHEGVSAKVTPLLDADQKKSWDKVHATKKP